MTSNRKKKKKISPRERTRRLFQSFSSKGGIGTDDKGDPIWFNYKPDVNGYEIIPLKELMDAQQTPNHSGETPTG